jgi:hypothetical protein
MPYRLAAQLRHARVRIELPLVGCRGTLAHILRFTLRRQVLTVLAATAVVKFKGLEVLV